MRQREYDRDKVKVYVKEWAYRRNPAYYNFDNVGGDCTSFASQCIFEGSEIMNYHKENGWYYRNGNNKSTSWSGVEFLYNFLIKNKSVGPFGNEKEQENLEVGDIIQLSFDGKQYGHTLVVVENDITKGEIYVASHTADSFHRKLSTYSYNKVRFLHIEAVRIW